MKKYIILILKGLGIGAANIIPGVSGGTIALITGIFEEIINSLKSFDLTAVKLLFTGKLKKFAEHINFFFLLAVFGGAGGGVYGLAFVLKPLFEHYPVFVWSFFLGLIAASIYFVGKKITKWTFSVFLTFIAGTVVALIITVVLDPAQQNDSFIYVFVCGIVAVCSMILPGLSGSFVLLLMGNYELIMIEAVKNLNINLIIPFGAGCVIGLLAFSHFLSWVFKKFPNQTIATLTGFIMGSLGILWPWKTEITKLLENGKEKVIGYHWFIPKTVNLEAITAVLLIIAGIIIIWFLEKTAEKKQ
jgi:putative membrane protein